jgi:steroid delta-isomerase-like uncharacterized protein
LEAAVSPEPCIGMLGLARGPGRDRGDDADRRVERRHRNDVVGAPEPFVGPAQTAERYRKHWEGFPDFAVRVRRILCADESCVVTENEWRGTHLGTFLGWPPTGKPVRMRAIVVWHFKGDALWGETIFFDNAALLKQIGAQIEIPPPTGAMKPAAFTLDDTALLGHAKAFE